MIKIYFAESKKICGLYEKLLPLLPAERQKKAERLLKKEDRILSALSGALLKKALDLNGSEEILYSEHGKPHIEGKPCFCISHSKNLALLAVSDEEVGADVEASKKVRPNVLKRCFSDEEKAFAEASPEDLAKIWVLKEAAVKLLGKGMSLPFKSFSVMPADEMHVIDGKEVFFFSGEIVGIPFAVASHSRIKEVEIYEITPKDIGLIY